MMCSALTQVQKSLCLRARDRRMEDPVRFLSPVAGRVCGQPSMRQPIDEVAQGCLGTWLWLELEWGCGQGLEGG